MYGLTAGDPGDIACGDQAGLYPGLNPESIGENPAAPGVIPPVMPGDHEGYDGVALGPHGVICGEPILLPGLAPPGPNIPRPTKKISQIKIQ